MQKSEAKTILEFVSNFQDKAQSIVRYEGNPYVEGDSIAEHLSRLGKLLICIAPHLKKEFPENTLIVEEIFTCLFVHDDDEVIDGFDIPTAMKVHNVKDEEEIVKFKHSVHSLDDKTKESLTSAFTSFRKKDSLASKIAKALDNISGNQLVIEQKIGLINPDQAKFAVEYVEKVRGISKTIDILIDAQIDQIIEERINFLQDVEGLKKLPQKSEMFLKIDLTNHVLDKAKINIPLSDL